MPTMTAARERPILFSGPMIRAILAGTKTQTRRVARIPECTLPGAYFDAYNGGPDWCWWTKDNRVCNGSGSTICPYGKPGDRLWVRETFYVDDSRYPDAPIPEMLEAIEYRASHDCANWEAGCPCSHGDWRRSIHMPRWASRITLEITDVRVERLQSITRGGRASGRNPGDVRRLGRDEVPRLRVPPVGQHAIRRAVAAVLDQINGKRPGCSWDANPFVWAITFRRLDP